MSATLSEIALEHIEDHYKPMRFARELLARAAGVTPNSARNWLRRECSPQVDNFGEMVRNDPEFRAKVRAWLESHEP